jgi:hypothetical protein
MGRAFVHETDVYFNAPYAEFAIGNHDIDIAADLCVFQVNIHRYVQSAVLDPEDPHTPIHHGPCKVSAEPRDYEALHPFFAWLPRDVIRKTFDLTTQDAHMPINTVLRKRFKSPNPAINVSRHDESVATDTIKSSVPAIDGGETYAQFFVGTRSLLSSVHRIKTPAQFPGVLMDEIIDCGAPTKLVSDSAQVDAICAELKIDDRRNIV